MFRAVSKEVSFPAGKVTTVSRAVITAANSSAVRAAEAEMGAGVNVTGIFLFVRFCQLDSSVLYLLSVSLVFSF